MEALQADPAVLLALAERCAAESGARCHMARATLTNLAAECEAATGPSRDLDFRIWHAIATTTVYGTTEAPAFSASIDAALTLVPEGYFVHRIGQYADMSMWGVTIFRQSDLRLQFPLYGEATSGARSAGAAALRARAHLSAQRPSTPSSDHPNP